MEPVPASDKTPARPPNAPSKATCTSLRTSRSISNRRPRRLLLGVGHSLHLGVARQAENGATKIAAAGADRLDQGCEIPAPLRIAEGIEPRAVTKSRHQSVPVRQGDDGLAAAAVEPEDEIAAHPASPNLAALAGRGLDARRGLGATLRCDRHHGPGLRESPAMHGAELSVRDHSSAPLTGATR